MIRNLALLSMLTVAIAACQPTGDDTAVRYGTDGKPLPKVYRIGTGQEGAIQYRMLDSVNSLRSAAGLQQVQLNAQLNASAATHARDMSVQNRAWHFGSDGSSPIDRAQRAGYTGRLVGEAISETYETELETLAAWMNDPASRRIIMDKSAADMGFEYYQDPNGKIWWMLIMGGY